MNIYLKAGLVTAAIFAACAAIVLMCMHAPNFMLAVGCVVALIFIVVFVYAIVLDALW